MAWRIDDRWLWLSLTIVGVGAVLGVHASLQTLLHSTTTTSVPPKNTFEPSQETEDAIPDEALCMLASHHNRDISKSAIEIFCHRVLRDQDAYESIQADLESDDDKTRNYATMAVKLCRKYDSTAFILKQDNVKNQTQAPVQPRVRDGSREEQARRRRRREAIVLNEGDRPVTQEDIIQRQRTG